MIGFFSAFLLGILNQSIQQEYENIGIVHRECAKIAKTENMQNRLVYTHLYGIVVEAGMVPRFGASRPAARLVPGKRSILSFL